MKIKSLQALRALAFFGIFFCHSGFFIEWPALGVSVFFVLSGFLMSYKYSELEYKVSFLDNIKYSISKIKKIYNLHIITMFLSIILCIYVFLRSNSDFSNYVSMIEKALLNIFLVQTWVPETSINTSLNGVAWYLSVSLFLYFMFPLINSKIKNIKNRNLMIIMISIIIIETLSCLLFVKYGINNSIYIWFMYFFPIFRLGDFIMGYCLGLLYKRRKEDKQKDIKNIIIYSIIELVALTLTVIVFKTYYYNLDIVYIAFHNWTTPYIIVASIWVWLFVINKGIITTILTNKLLIKIGNISPYLFLIHFIVIQYTNEVLYKFNIQLTIKKTIVIVLFELIISIILSVFYNKLERRIREKRKIGVINEKYNN